MKILHIIDSLDLGGAERMAVELANVAHWYGHETGILATRALGPLEEELDPAVRRWSLQRTRRFHLRLRRVKAILRQWRPQLLHVHGRSSMAFATLLKALKALPFPAVFHDHYGRIWVDERPRRFFAAAVGWAAARFVGVSEKNASWAIASGFPPGRVRVIGNALDFARLRGVSPVVIEKEVAQALVRPVGIFVGGIRAEKGLLELIRALGQLPRESPWSLLVVGGGLDTSYGQTCKAEAERLQLASRLHLLGPRRDAVGLAKSCDFAVIPSLSESGPLVLIEYLACGLPTVATDTGEVVQRLPQDAAVRRVPAGDIAALATAMAELVEMLPETRKTLGQNSWKKARGQFDLRQVFRQWETVYAEAASVGK